MSSIIRRRSGVIASLLVRGATDDAAPRPTSRRGAITKVGRGHRLRPPRSGLVQQVINLTGAPISMPTSPRASRAQGGASTAVEVAAAGGRPGREPARRHVAARIAAHGPPPAAAGLRRWGRWRGRRRGPGAAVRDIALEKAQISVTAAVAAPLRRFGGHPNPAGQAGQPGGPAADDSWPRMTVASDPCVPAGAGKLCEGGCSVWRACCG